MTEEALLLRILQEGDSFFPSGAVSFSWGLETLCSDGLVTKEGDVANFLLAQLTYRWASFDRIAVIEAAKASQFTNKIVEVDQVVEAQTLPDELRSGSRRNGCGLLSVHAKLGTPGARDYLAGVRASVGFGHVSVMQGFLWRQRGIPPDEAVLLSAYVLCVGILGAAVRIGVIGHIAAQKILIKLQPTISRLAAGQLASLDEIHCFLPQAEIASMRHETAATRLFAN
jgi:urease accessory protein